jgi:two-component system nitrogen regulation response regulator GlnG
LRNFVYRLALLSREDLIDAAGIAPLLAPTRGDSGETTSLGAAVSRWLAEARPAPGAVYDAALAAFEAPLFAGILEQTGGNQLRAAQVLGINRNTLRKRLNELQIDPEAYAEKA